MRLADHVVEKLLALVQDRGLQPGQKLPAERQLAEELGVSRTSVREAIQKLTSQGVLSARRGDGTYVQQIHKPAEWLQEAMVPLAGLINPTRTTATTCWRRATRSKPAPPGWPHSAPRRKTKPTSSAALK